MSNNKKKALLNEAATRRFWKLAGLKPIHEKAFVFEEEEELEEMRAKKEDEKDEVDEGMRGKKEDEDLDEGMRGKKEDEDLDEGMRGKKKDEDLDEGMRGKKKDEDLDEMKTGGLKASGIKGVYDVSDRFKDDEEVEVTPSGTKIKTVKPRKMNEEDVDENMDRPAPGGIKGVYSHKFKDDEDEYAPKTVKIGNKGSTMTTAKPRKMNEDDLEEEMEIDEMGMDAAAEDEPEMDMGAEEGPEDGQDVEVDVPEGDVASLRTARDILDQILSAVDGADAEPAMDDEEPALDDDEDLNEVDQEELEEVAERIAQRVAKRISESLKRK